MTHVTCRLTAKNRDQLRNPTLGNRVWASLLTSTATLTEASVWCREMDMGWVHPWAGLGRVAFSSTCDGLGWVKKNGPMSISDYQRSVVCVVAQKPVLRESIACVARDRIDRSLVGLMLDGVVEQEQRSRHVLRQVPVHAHRQPARQQLLHHELRPATRPVLAAASLSLPLFYRLHDAVNHFLYAAFSPLRWKQDAAGNKLGEETFSGGEL